MNLGMEIAAYVHGFLSLSSTLQTWESSRSQVLYKHFMGLISFNPQETPQVSINMQTRRQARVLRGLPKVMGLPLEGAGTETQTFDTLLGGPYPTLLDV